MCVKQGIAPKHFLGHVVARFLTDLSTTQHSLVVEEWFGVRQGGEELDAGMTERTAARDFSRMSPGNSRCLVGLPLSSTTSALKCLSHEIH